MPRLTPVHWKELERIFLSFGFVFVRQSGSHRVYEKPDVLRPLIIPAYSDVHVDIIAGLLRTAGIAREEFLARLAH